MGWIKKIFGRKEKEIARLKVEKQYLIESSELLRVMISAYDFQILKQNKKRIDLSAQIDVLAIERGRIQSQIAQDKGDW